MRIAIVTDYNNRTWIGKQNYQLYLSLKALWIDVDIINLVSPQGFRSVPEYWINIVTRFFLFGSFFSFRKELRTLIVQKNYDFVLLGHQWLAYLYNIIDSLGISQGINVFDLFTFYPEYVSKYDPRFWLFNNFFLKNVKKFQNIVFDSNFAKNDYDIFFWLEGKKTIVTPIWFDAESVGNICEPNNIQELLWKKIILHVGSEEKRKNIDTFFDISELYSSRSDILFVRIGKTSEKSKEKILSGRYSNIRYFSNVSEPELRWFYRNSRIFLFTSLHEWFGMPIVEAYSNNLLIVSTKVSDMALLFKNDPNVFFVNNSKNPQDYSDKISLIMNNNVSFAQQANFPVPSTKMEAEAYLSFIKNCVFLW